jgi:hypothetical protein
MKLNPKRLAPMNPLKSIRALVMARINHSQGMLVNPMSNLFKLR